MRNKMRRKPYRKTRLKQMESGELQSITVARFSKLPSANAIKALQERNQRRKREDPYDAECAEAEKALLARRDPLIDLSLGQYGLNKEVLTELYQRSLRGTGDEVLDMGIRVAILANQLAPARFWEENPALSNNDVRRLAVEGTTDEVQALLTNPMTRKYIGELYRQRPPFDALDDDRFRTLVGISARNPRLAFDDSTRDGPDFHRINISTGIYEMLSTVPLTTEWLWTLDRVLSNYMPEPTYGQKTITQVIDRWRPLEIKEYNSDQLSPGFYTDLTMTEEFCCRVAAMFGRYLEGNRWKVAGAPDSHDVVLRCMYYGNHDMKPADMEAAHEKDGPTFTFAAIHNSHFYWNRACRIALESMLRGDQMNLYSRYCAKMGETEKGFNPKPVSDDFVAEAEAQLDPLSQIRESIGLLQGRITAIQKDASTVKTLGIWCLLLLVGVLWHLT